MVELRKPEDRRKSTKLLESEPPQSSQPPKQKAPASSSKTSPATSASTSDTETENLEEDPHKDPYDCVCGKTGRANDGKPCIHCTACCRWVHHACLGLPVYAEDLDADHFFCARCAPGEYPAFSAAAARGEQPWVRNQRVFEVLWALRAERVQWFWGLYCRLSAENLAAMREGRRLKGAVVRGTPTAEYRERAERAFRGFLAGLGDEEVAGLHGRVLEADGRRSRMWNLLREAGEKREGEWRGWGGELAMLFELFGWERSEDAGA